MTQARSRSRRPLRKSSAKVAKVNTIKLPGKWKRMGVHVGKRPDIKKAVVTLTADSKKIEIFENMM